MTDSCKHCNGHSGPAKVEQFLELTMQLQASECDVPRSQSTKKPYGDRKSKMKFAPFPSGTEREKHFPILPLTLCFGLEPFSFDDLSPASFLFILPYTFRASSFSGRVL